jgi:hypothetical protein
MRLICNGVLNVAIEKDFSFSVDFSASTNHKTLQRIIFVLECTKAFEIKFLL